MKILRINEGNSTRKDKNNRQTPTKRTETPGDNRRLISSGDLRGGRPVRESDRSQSQAKKDTKNHVLGEAPNMDPRSCL